jgi:hypothetical protein
MMLGVGLAAAAAVVLGTMQVGTIATIAVSVGLLGAAAMLARPDIGTFVFLTVAYTNGVVLIGGALGNASLVGAAFSGLLMVPIFVHVFVRRQAWLFDYPFLLMILFGGGVLLSTMMAKDHERALSWVMTFVLEGLLLYFLLLNAVRSLPTLRHIMWTLAIVGGVMGSMAIYQELTGNYDQQFGGIMQRNTSYGYEDQGLDDGVVREREKVRVAHRAGGPLGGPNRCAQILLTMLPLSLLLVWIEKSRNAKLLAAAFSALTLAGVLLTYSRGGFVSLVGLVLLLFLFGYLRVRQLIVGAVAVFFLLVAIAPGYIARIESVTGLSRITSEAQVEKKQGDSTIRGRLTEMLAAFNVFLDYPILGVGPGQYSPYYSLEYMANPEIQFRHIESTRRAHILYFELAAETGIVGLGLFMTIAGVILARLWRLRMQLRRRRPELAHAATAFFCSIMMYFGTAVFLHFSYQRYYWITLALAGIAARLIQEAASRPTPEEEEAAAAWLVDELSPSEPAAVR